MFLDITDNKSVDNLDGWLPILRSQDPYIPLMLVGFDYDLKKECTIQTHKAVQIAKNKNFQGYFKIRLESGSNIEMALKVITKLMYHSKTKRFIF